MENIDVVRIVVNYLIPTILGICVGFITTRIKKASNKEKAIEEGVQALLRNELVRRYREYELKGELSILDKENIEAMFKQYENLGGNGTVKQLMTELLQLKTKVIIS